MENRRILFTLTLITLFGIMSSTLACPKSYGCGNFTDNATCTNESVSNTSNFLYQMRACNKNQECLWETADAVTNQLIKCSDKTITLSKR